jgi:hypothetical protein
MGPYHAMMVHFPVALWTVAALILVGRGLIAIPLTEALDRVLVPVLFLATAFGTVAYVFGMLVWPPETVITTPLGRNHIMAATWSLLYWFAVMVLRWWVGEAVWQGALNRLIMLGLGALGVGLMAITGTIGGHLHGAPTHLSSILRAIGWEVYATFYFPNWILVLLLVVVVAMPLIALKGRRTAAGGSNA